MDLTIPLIALCLAVFAFGLSVVSLVFQWIKRAETPGFAPIYAELSSVRAEILDIMDKIDHWRKRDNVRKAREKAEERLPDPQAELPLPATKAELRAKATALGLGIVSR